MIRSTEGAVVGGVVTGTAEGGLVVAVGATVGVCVVLKIGSVVSEASSPTVVFVLEGDTLGAVVGATVDVGAYDKVGETEGGEDIVGGMDADA
eukprot:CAMPEP_0194449146 /NCGR_PEP_ID=MMETSP0176-20130528/129973_1 /TAXON_ID=216777 /ORGANISM="Proboscia alata, Strain PI-D3" /LENGTH=92 /DNA_ID=CAMNT_0039276223 /DNA_START=747 /DNA_END=1022 /DNA_ORIENTATION=+